MKRQIDSSGAALDSVDAKLEKSMLVVATRVVTAAVPSVEHAVERASQTPR
jgi:hypothetical protein